LPPRIEPAANPAAAARTLFGIRGMTSIVTASVTATLGIVPGVTAASSIRIAPERQPRGRGGAGSVNLSAASLAALITVDRHSSLRGATLRLQSMTAGRSRALLISMAGRACDPPPDPAHEVPVAERAEGLKVPGDRGTAADNRLPEIEVRGAGSERGVAPGAPVPLPLDDGRPGLIRYVCIPDRQRCLYSVLSGHAEWILIPDDKPFDRRGGRKPDYEAPGNGDAGNPGGGRRTREVVGIPGSAPAYT